MAEYYDQNADGGTQAPWVTLEVGSADMDPAALRQLLLQYPGYNVRLADGSVAMLGQNGGITVATPTDGGVMTRNITSDGYDATNFNADTNTLQRNLIGTAGIVAAPFVAAGAQGLLGATPAASAATGAAGATSAAAPAAASTGAAATGATMGADGVIYPTAAQAAAASAAAPAAASAVTPGASNNDAIDQSLGDAARRAGVNIPADLGGYKTITDWLRANPWAASLVGATAALADNKPITSQSNSSSTTSGTNSSNVTSNSSTASQSQSGLAAWQMPYAQSALDRANALANSPAPTYNGELTAGTTADQQTSYDLIRKLATQGDPTMTAGASYVQDVLGGKYLNANPYIDTVAKNIGDRMGDSYATGTRANLFSSFNNDGNSVANKSGGAQSMFTSDRAFGDSLGNTLSNLYYGNYRDERIAQGSAASLAPTYGTWNMNAAQALNNAGTQQQATNQAADTARYADWLRQQDYPFRTAQLMNQTINPSWGSQANTASTGANQTNTWGANNSTQTGSNSSTIDAPSSWQAILAGALGGNSIYRNIFK